MAKTNEQFDRIFKEKLEGHQEKPSALAWERLESQLPKNPKSGWGVWWAIAASVTALLVAYLIWPNSGEVAEEALLAQSEEVVAPAPAETNPADLTEALPAAEPTMEEGSLESKSSTSAMANNAQPKAEGKKTPTPPKQETISKPLVAEVLPKELETKTQGLSIPEVTIGEPEIELPNLKAPDLSKTVAENTSSEEQPLYRVSIFSNGIKKGEAADKNLITELGKTVGQVEGFLGKVDDGFAEIQDKKDNLFASLTTRKERADQ